MSQATQNLAAAVAEKSAATAAHNHNMPEWGGARLRTREAARYLACSEGVLRSLRLKRSGPAFSRLAYNIVVYSTDDLDKWLAANRVETAQAAA